MKSRNSLFILLAIFIVPIVLGNLFFFLYPNFFIAQTVNYGVLIKPIIQLKKVDYLQGRWSLLYRTEYCDNTCKTVLNKAKTLHLLTNDKAKRLQRLLLTSKDYVNKVNITIKPLDDYTSSQLADFAPQTLFLVDPLGNVVLAYDGLNFNIKKALKDLKRLLKYSRVG